MKFKQVIGLFLMFGAFIGLIICCIASVIFGLQNPDMTDLRKLIEYPDPGIWAIICFICVFIGKTMLMK